MFWQSPQRTQSGHYFRNSCAENQNATRFSQESELMELTLVKGTEGGAS